MLRCPTPLQADASLPPAGFTWGERVHHVPLLACQMCILRCKNSGIVKNDMYLVHGFPWQSLLAGS